MQPFSTAIMTDAGAELFMKAQSGETKIQFTRISVGDGVYSDEEKNISSKQKKTALKSLKNSYPISKKEIVSSRSIKLTALITNYDPVGNVPVVESGYYINEMGLFAREDGDEENEMEILYSIAIVESKTGDFMPPYDGHNPAQIIQDYYATVSNSEEVTIEIGKGAAALADDLEKILFLDFDDSGEVEGIESFTDFMEKFVKRTSIYQIFANLKAGLKYVLHTGKLVNSGMCETPGEFALDAAYGKYLTDQISQVYSDFQDLNNSLAALDTKVDNAITGGTLAPPYEYDYKLSNFTFSPSNLQITYNTADRWQFYCTGYGAVRTYTKQIPIKNGYKLKLNVYCSQGGSNYSLFLLRNNVKISTYAIPTISTEKTISLTDFVGANLSIAIEVPENIKGGIDFIIDKIIITNKE